MPCLDENCKINRPVFNLPGQTKGLYCVAHKNDVMVNVRAKKCMYFNCNTRPYYNYIHNKGPLYCVTHKKDGMIDVTNKRCIYLNCNIQSSYNYIGEKIPLYCVTHKKDEMIDIKNKRCIHPDCNTRPIYNNPVEKIALYCNLHKKDGMIDIKSKRCINSDCNIRPTYNIPGEKIPLYCNLHKTNGMIDIKSKRCIHDKCIIRANFNNPGEKPALYCNLHKIDGMIDIEHKRCIYHDCDKRPSYNNPCEKTALYCVIHKQDVMIDIINKRCKLCPIIISNKQYKGYCYRCFIYTFPDSLILRNHKTKERTVADYIKQEFPDYDFKFDKIIQDGCSKRRPDILLDMGEYNIIVEIDENQHQKYDCSCENKRLMEIFQDCGSRPLVMIRFNPDQYYINNKSIPSCWTTTEDRGLCIIKSTKKKEWDTRLQSLKEAIKLQIDFTGERKEIDVIHLFYD